MTPDSWIGLGALSETAPIPLGDTNFSDRAWLQPSTTIGAIHTSTEMLTQNATKNSSGKTQAIRKEIYKLSERTAREQRSVGNQSRSVIVALIDSGIDAQSHTSISTRLWQNPNEWDDGIDNSENGFIDDISGWDFVGNDPFPLDENGHGTMMAGLIVKEAPMARLMNLRVLDGMGMGAQREVSAAIDYAINNKAQVINLSLGSDQEDQEVSDTIERALRAGVVVVAASGNEGRNKPDYPARLEGVWAAGTLDRNGNPWKMSNGSQGKGKQYISLESKHIKSLKINGGRGFITGTSAAAARLSGIFASLISLRSQSKQQLPQLQQWLPEPNYLSANREPR